jgi:hypothetical protein
MCELASNRCGKACYNCVDIFEKMCHSLIISPERMVTAMKRNAIQDLINWKNDEERKPLVLKGARQVGKT